MKGEDKLVGSAHHPVNRSLHLHLREQLEGELEEKHRE